MADKDMSIVWNLRFLTEKMQHNYIHLSDYTKEYLRREEWFLSKRINMAREFYLELMGK